MNGATPSAIACPIFRLAATRSTNGPAQVHSGLVLPDEGWMHAATSSSSSRFLGGGCGRMGLGGIELADLLRRHPRPPARLAVDPAPSQRACPPAVQEGRLEAVRVDLVPEGAARDDAVVALEVLLPDVGGLVDVAVDVDDGHQ